MGLGASQSYKDSSAELWKRYTGRTGRTRKPLEAEEIGQTHKGRQRP